MFPAFRFVSLEQAGSVLLAVPAFLPALTAPGYVAAWTADLHGFRHRSLVERIFWSIPLSCAIAPIASWLLTRFVSLTAASLFFAGCGLVWVVLLATEHVSLRRSGSRWNLGWRPLGTPALLLALFWIILAALSLIDFESHQRLYFSTTLYDHSFRVAWTEAIERTGVPPANPLYWFQHAVPLRSYYSWYVVCAAVARLAHLPARFVFIASCIWAGFALAALVGLYLKHFLEAGERLRRQFLLAIALLTVTGLDLLGVLWDLMVLNLPLPPDLEWWSRGQIASWLSSLLWVPHHIASLVCCMTAFLLAWMGPLSNTGLNPASRRLPTAALISFALASAFGLSIYVAFAFFLIMVVWSVWQFFADRAPHAVLWLTIGGAAAVVLLFPYLHELLLATSGNSGDHVFAFAVREMIPPEFLFRRGYLHALVASHPDLARNLANLLLLVPGYILELGFFLLILLVDLVPAWRNRRPLTAAERSLLVITVAALVLISFLRSWVLQTNDFGWRAALFVQFPLLLLASNLLVAAPPAASASNPVSSPSSRWLRSAFTVTLWIGVAGTCCQALVLRFYMPLAAAHDAETARFAHNAAVSRIGYAQLASALPGTAIVQYNPHVRGLFGIGADLLNVDRQTAMFSDRLQCGSLWGGDPGGCAAMAAAIDPLFNDAATSPSQDGARSVCARFGIDVLVARSDDPAWAVSTSWVWTLPAVVSDPEFRALDCRSVTAPSSASAPRAAETSPLPSLR